MRILTVYGVAPRAAGRKLFPPFLSKGSAQVLPLTLLGEPEHRPVRGSRMGARIPGGVS
jgi:hypothetical protein